MELSDNEREVLTRLREVLAHGYGVVAIKVQKGSIWTIEQQKDYRPNEKNQPDSIQKPTG